MPRISLGEQEDRMSDNIIYEKKISGRGNVQKTGYVRCPEHFEISVCDDGQVTIVTRGMVGLEGESDTVGAAVARLVARLQALGSEEVVGA
jgi:hypothetical protein